MTYPDRASVFHKLASKPEFDSDHVLLEALIVSDRARRPAARCFEDIVVYDYRNSVRTCLKPYMVEKLREVYDLQQKNKEKCETEVARLMETMRMLESRGE
jgi:hypothetical protein